MIRRPPLLPVAIFALTFGAPGTLPAQSHRMVSIGRSNQPGQIRLWEVSGDGGLTLIQKIDRPIGTGDAEVDPLGRFVVVPEPGVDPGAILLFEVTPDRRLALVDTFTRRGWRFAGAEHTLTPDGELYITFAERLVPPTEAVFEVFHITPDLNLVPGDRLRISPDGPLNVWPPEGPLAACRTPAGAHTLFSGSRAGDLSYISVLPLTASAEFTGLAQQLGYRGIFPLEGWAVRQDQRLLVVGSSITLPPISFAIGPEGLLSFVDLWDVDQLGVWNIGALQFRPGGTELINSRLLSRAPLSTDGQFTQPPTFFPEAGALLDAPPAITSDARLAVTTWEIDGEGIHWGVFDLDRGPEIVLLADHPRPDDFRDVAFIPPRTEELRGDANADGRRDAADLVTYLAHLADDPDIGGPTDPTITGSVPRARADADQDNDIDEKDLDWLLAFLLGL